MTQPFRVKRSEVHRAAEYTGKLDSKQQPTGSGVGWLVQWLGCLFAHHGAWVSAPGLTRVQLPAKEGADRGKVMAQVADLMGPRADQVQGGCGGKWNGK